MHTFVLVLSVFCAGHADREKVHDLQEQVKYVAEHLQGNAGLANLARLLLASDPAATFTVSGPRARLPMSRPTPFPSSPASLDKRLKMQEVGEDLLAQDEEGDVEFQDPYPDDDLFQDPNLVSNTVRDPHWLAQFVDHYGMILPRTITGLNNKQQRKMSKLVKLARQMKLMPYSAKADDQAGIPTDDITDEELEEKQNSKGNSGSGLFAGALGGLFDELPDDEEDDGETNDEDEMFFESMGGGLLPKEALEAYLPEGDAPEAGSRVGDPQMKLQDDITSKGEAAKGKRRGDVSMKLEDVESGVEKLISRFGLPGQGIDTRTHRRSAIGLGLASMALPLLANVAPASAAEGMFSLPPLPYAYDALEPHIDASTMKFHHDFHHQAYINNLNKAMAGKAEASLVSLMPGAKAAKLNNAGGGHYNHCLFWNIMGPKAGGEPTGTLAEKMTAAFGSYDEFKAKFSAAAAGVFGSGWAWLAVAKDGSVKIVTTPNQDNPLMEGATEAGLIPIMGIDVWEHAYYLKYQNRRPEYISAFFNVINWAKVGEYYATAAAGTPISF
mmetsp:Transcript_104727/g.180931  ORF Transcript_104727/g.180931 Transcript_104727/m.180931 type:complete len:555 (-) Transcript_104727:235-1899(-)